MKKRPRTLRYKLLMAVVLCGVVVWSVVWFIAATIVDRRTEKVEHMAVTAGAMADCVNRSVAGFPFRIELRCGQGSRIGTVNANVHLESLVATALIYKPNRIIAEARGPAIVTVNGIPEIDIDWSLAHASARFDLSSASLERLDAEVETGTVVAGANSSLSFEELDFNARRDPAVPTAVDVSVRVQNLVPLPGVAPASFSIQGMLEDSSDLLAGRPEALIRAMLDDGLSFVLETARFESQSMKVNAAGKLAISVDGLVNGTLDIAISGYEDGVPYASLISAEANETLKTLLGNVLAFAPPATIDGEDAKKLALTITDGRVRAGIVPLFTIPPINVLSH